MYPQKRFERGFRAPLGRLLDQIPRKFGGGRELKGQSFRGMRWMDVKNKEKNAYPPAFWLKCHSRLRLTSLRLCRSTLLSIQGSESNDSQQDSRRGSEWLWIRVWTLSAVEPYGFSRTLITRNLYEFAAAQTREYAINIVVPTHEGLSISPSSGSFESE